jgi:hypothetical protein
LLKVRIDGHFDSFDVLSLGLAAAVSNTDWYTWMGTPRTFRRRLLLEKLLIFIIWQTQVPIPVPVFFRKVGVEYDGLFNVKAALGASFPEPEFNLMKLGELLKDLVEFARKPGFYLDEDKTLLPFDLQLSLGPAYLKLGKEGSLLNIGSDQTLDFPSVYQLLAKGLNAVKHFDIERAIRLVPEKYRYAVVPKTEVFPGMQVEGMWMVSTPSEFVSGKYTLMGISVDRMRELVELLPRQQDDPEITSTDKGVVAFINGHWQTDYARVEAMFAMMVIRSKRLAVQMRFKGNLSDALYIYAGGLLKIAPPQEPFQLKGKMESKLRLAGLDIYTGNLSIAVSADRFAMLGDLSVMAESNLFYIKAHEFGGTVSGKTFDLQGKITGKILFLEGAGEATVGLSGIEYWFTVAEAKVGLRLRKEGNALRIGGDIPIAGINFGSDSWIYPEESRFRLKLTTAAISGLFSMEFEKDTSIGSGTIDVDFRLYILKFINDEPVIACSTAIRADGVRVTGGFKLFHSGSPINLSGNVEGQIGLRGFNLEARVNVVPNLGLLLRITPSSFLLSGNVGPVVFAGKVFGWYDDVVTCLTWPGIFSPWWVYFSAKNPLPVWDKHPGYDQVSAERKRSLQPKKATAPLGKLTALALGFAAAEKNPEVKKSKELQDARAWAAKRYDWELKHESLAKGNSRITFSATRITKGKLSDFFTEVLDLLPEKPARPSLNGASLQLVFHTLNRNAGIKLTLRFPNAKLERHRKIVVKISGQEKDGLKEVVRAFERRK